jgi:hypothetical protein
MTSRDESFETFVAHLVSRMERHRAKFAILVAERHARPLDDEVAPVLAALREAAKGQPLDDASIASLSKVVETARSLIDPDRTFAFDQFRALDVLDAALRGSVRDMIVAALAASVGIPARASNVIAKLEEVWERHDIAAERRQLERAACAIEQGTDLDLPVLDVPARQVRPKSPEPTVQRVLKREIAPPPPPAPAPSPAHGSVRVPSVPVVLRATIGGATLELIETAAAPNQRFRVELDGERRRIRVRKLYLDLDTPRTGSHDWIEGEEADIDLLVECLEAERTKRSESAGLLVLQMQTFGLSGLDVTTTVTVARTVRES